MPYHPIHTSLLPRLFVIPEGCQIFSRWLSEAWRATPPESMIKKNPHPGGVPDTNDARILHPSGMRYFFMPLFRWYRSPSLAQPPAKFYHPGMKSPAAPPRPFVICNLEFGIFLEFVICNL